MATSYKLCSVLSLSCLVLIATTITATNRTKLVVPLIHRDSILPSLLNPNHDDDYPTAPLIPGNKLFFVNVSIGDPPIAHLVAFDTGSSLTWIQRPDVVIDSGSTLTLLKRHVYEPLRDEVTKLLDGVIEPVVGSRLGERLCYLGDMVRDLKGFPTVTLHLDNGADLSLDVEGVFQRIDESIFCLATEYTTPDRPLSIIGILAQQYHNVGFDMNEMKVTFLNIECELLQD